MSKPVLSLALFAFVSGFIGGNVADITLHLARPAEHKYLYTNNDSDQNAVILLNYINQKLDPAVSGKITAETLRDVMTAVVKFADRK